MSWIFTPSDRPKPFGQPHESLRLGLAKLKEIQDNLSQKASPFLQRDTLFASKDRQAKPQKVRMCHHLCQSKFQMRFGSSQPGGRNLKRVKRNFEEVVGWEGSEASGVDIESNETSESIEPLNPMSWDWFGKKTQKCGQGTGNTKDKHEADQAGDSPNQDLVPANIEGRNTKSVVSEASKTRKREDIKEMEIQAVDLTGGKRGVNESCGIWKREIGGETGKLGQQKSVGTGRKLGGELDRSKNTLDTLEGSHREIGNPIQPKATAGVGSGDEGSKGGVQRPNTGLVGEGGGRGAPEGGIGAYGLGSLNKCGNQFDKEDSEGRLRNSDNCGTKNDPGEEGLQLKKIADDKLPQNDALLDSETGFYRKIDPRNIALNDDSRNAETHQISTEKVPITPKFKKELGLQDIINDWKPQDFTQDMQLKLSLLMNLPTMIFGKLPGPNGQTPNKLVPAGLGSKYHNAIARNQHFMGAGNQALLIQNGRTLQNARNTGANPTSQNNHPIKFSPNQILSFNLSPGRPQIFLNGPNPLPQDTPLLRQRKDPSSFPRAPPFNQNLIKYEERLKTYKLTKKLRRAWNLNRHISMNVFKKQIAIRKYRESDSESECSEGRMEAFNILPSNRKQRRSKLQAQSKIRESIRRRKKQRIRQGECFEALEYKRLIGKRVAEDVFVKSGGSRKEGDEGSYASGEREKTGTERRPGEWEYVEFLDFSFKNIN